MPANEKFAELAQIFTQLSTSVRDSDVDRLEELAARVFAELALESYGTGGLHALTHAIGGIDEVGSLPTAGEKAALAGTDGVPGAGNRYVTDSDSRLGGVGLRGVDDAIVAGIPIDGTTDAVADLVTHYGALGAGWVRPLRICDTDILRIATTWELQAKWKLIAEQPASIKIETGIILYIAGKLEAGLYPIFQFVGTGKVKFHRAAHVAGEISRGTYSPEVYGEWFSVMMDATGDDSPGWERWIEATISPYIGGSPLVGNASALNAQKIPAGANSRISRPILYEAIDGLVLEGAGQRNSYIHSNPNVGAPLHFVTAASGDTLTVTPAPDTNISTGRMHFLFSNGDNPPLPNPPMGLYTTWPSYGVTGFLRRITGAGGANQIVLDYTMAEMGLVDLGVYNAATTYNAYEYVTSGGYVWVAQRTVVGVTPVEGLDWQRLEGYILWNAMIDHSGCFNANIRDFSMYAAANSPFAAGIYFHRNSLRTLKGSSQPDIRNVTVDYCGLFAAMSFGNFQRYENTWQEDLVTASGLKTRGLYFSMAPIYQRWHSQIGLRFGPDGPPSNAVNYNVVGVVTVSHKYGIFIINTNLNLFGQTVQTNEADIFVHSSTIASTVKGLRNEDSHMVLDSVTPYAYFPSNFHLTEYLARGNGLKRVPGTGRCRLACWDLPGLLTFSVQLTEPRLLMGGPSAAITAVGADWFEATLAGVNADEVGKAGSAPPDTTTNSGAMVSIIAAGTGQVRQVGYILSHTATGGAPAPAGKVRFTLEKPWAEMVDIPAYHAYTPTTSDKYQIDAVPVIYAPRGNTTIDLSGCQLVGGPERVMIGNASWFATAYRRINAASEVIGSFDQEEQRSIGESFHPVNLGDISGTYPFLHRAGRRIQARPTANLVLTIGGQIGATGVYAPDPMVGECFVVELTQDATGGWSVTFPTDATHPIVWDGAAPPFTWAANITKHFWFYWDNIRKSWLAKVWGTW